MVSTIKSHVDLKAKLSSSGGKLIVLDFYATWCEPCKQMEPHLKNLAKMYEDRVAVIKINVDKFEDVCYFYNVRVMPTFVFLRKNKIIYRFNGADPVKLYQKTKYYV